MLLQLLCYAMESCLVSTNFGRVEKHILLKKPFRDILSLQITFARTFKSRSTYYIRVKDFETPPKFQIQPNQVIPFVSHYFSRLSLFSLHEPAISADAADTEDMRTNTWLQ
jgi:hypothetical protein